MLLEIQNVYFILGQITTDKEFSVCTISKLATIVKGDPKVPFSIATTPGCRGGRYFIPGIAPLYPWSSPYSVECLARLHQVPFFESLVWLDLGLNLGHPDHWRTLYSLGQWPGICYNCPLKLLIVLLLLLEVQPANWPWIHQKSQICLYTKNWIKWNRQYRKDSRQRTANIKG